MPKHPLKIHLWGAISKKGPSCQLAFDGIMDSEFYVETVLRLGLLPFIYNFFPDRHRFIQDNDPKHRSRRTKQFMIWCHQGAKCARRALPTRFIKNSNSAPFPIRSVGTNFMLESLIVFDMIIIMYLMFYTKSSLIYCLPLASSLIQVSAVN